MKKILLIGLMFIFTLSVCFADSVPSIMSAVGTTTYYVNKTDIFQGMSNDYGFSAFTININDSFKVSSDGNDKAVMTLYNDINAPTIYPVGNGSIYGSFKVYKGSQLINTHNFNSFTSYSVIKDPNRYYYYYNMKNTSDSMNANLTGKVEISYDFFHDDYMPWGSWSRSYTTNF